MKKVFVLVLMLVLIAATIGSGALSAAKLYHRTAQAHVIMDTGPAYLHFAPQPPNGWYVHTDASGRMKLEFGENPTGGRGLNPDSENWFTSTFTVTNLGTENLKVWFVSDNPRCKIYWGTNAPAVDGYADGAPSKPMINKGAMWTFGVYLDARWYDAGDVLSCGITVMAEK